MNELESRYRILAPSLGRLEEEGVYILNEALRTSGIKVHSIVSRVKTLESFLDKIARKNLSAPFDEIDDLVGVRVVCLFRSDIQKIGGIIRGQFTVTSEDDKLDGVSLDVFGYQSVHFVSSIKPSHSGPRYEGLHDLRLEIQLRTLAMDAWASLSHYLDYKSEADVPRDLRKDFFALSGLFYVADTHFELFYEARQRAGVAARKDATATPTEEQELNLDSLGAYLAKRYPDREHSRPSDISELVGELAKAGYTNLGQLHSALEDSASLFAQYELRNPPVGVAPRRFSNVGVVRISLGILDPKFCEIVGYTDTDLMLKLRSEVVKRAST